MFANFNIENNNPQIAFSPGSILDAILKRKSLIIKDIHKISTEVFERFNEFFGTERMLNLNEDIYGTFFPKDEDNIFDIKQIEELEKKEIFIIATCPENSFQSLSESVLSRFSIICVGEHEKEEKKRIIEIYANEFDIEGQYIDKIKNLLDDGFSDIKKIKNLIYIFNKMNKKIINNKDNNQIDKCFELIMSFIKLNDNNSLYDDPLYQEDKNPLYYEDNCLISKITKLKIDLDTNLQNDKLNPQNIIFIPTLNKMLDILHFGICTGTPLIFEGYSGQGKQTAINYICNLLNYDIENIIITKNLTYKDLYKKIIIENNSHGEVEIVDIHTRLYEALNKGNDNKIIFIFHNIQLAEPDVLSELSQIFNKRGNESYSFIGIINNKENLIERDYYYNYFFNSIYYKINFSKNKDVEKFISHYLKLDKQSESSISNYYQNQDENTDDNLLTLSNMVKFLKLKEISSFENQFLEEISFMNNNIIKNDIELDLTYISKDLIIEVNNKSFIIPKISRYNKFDEEVNTLSFDQKKCLIFLCLAIQSKRACIIQGKTGVGKSHIIKLLANILNKKLHVFEVNKDNDISLLTKSCNFKNYTNSEKNEIEKILDEIMNKNKIPNNNLDFQKKYEKICEIENLEEESKVQLEKLKKKYKFINRFKYENSEFLDAIEKGEWILLDGIENASSLILEKLILLCGEKPELNLYEKDKEAIIPKDSFHLFMTYNPERKIQIKKLPNDLSDNCFIYYLDSFLDEETSMSQIIYGFLVNLDLNRDIKILKDISSRLSKIFKIIKEEIDKESEKISEISERAFINFLKNLNYEEFFSKTAINIKNNFLYFCFPSFDKKKYFDIIYNNIKEEGSNFKYLAKSYSLNCGKSKNLLNDFEKNIDEGNFEQSLDFSEFIFSCLEVPFRYIYELIDSIEKTKEKAEKKNFKGIYKPLYIFLNYFNELKDSYEKENGANLLKIKIKDLIFPKIIILRLYEELIKNNYFNGECLDLLYDSINYNILGSILKLYKEKNINNLIKFFELITCNKKYLKDILKIFPYLAFRNTKFKLLNRILESISDCLNNNNINLSIKIDNKQYELTQNGKIKILFVLNTNNNNELILTESTIFSETIHPKYKDNPEYIFNLCKNYSNIEDKITKALESDSYESNFEFKNNTFRKEEYTNFFNRFFKKENNLIIYIWSLIFLDNKIINEEYLSLFCKDSFNIEINIFKICLNLYKQLINYTKDYEQKINEIIDINNELNNSIKDINILYNLSFNKNYHEKYNNLEERKNIRIKIKNELEIINKLKELNISDIFVQYRNLLNKELDKISNEIKYIEIENYKNNIISILNEKKNLENQLKENLSKSIRSKDNIEDLKPFEDLIKKYNNNEKQKSLKKSIYDKYIFNECYNNDIKLIELLIKYSEIIETFKEIKKNENKLNYIEKLNELIDSKYINLFLEYCFEPTSDKNKEYEKIIKATVLSMFLKEVISQNLEHNLINIKNLLNNLYDIKNYNLIDEKWCETCLKNKYNPIIYIPKLNNLSFGYLFIRINNLKEKKPTPGFLLEKKKSFYLDVLNEPSFYKHLQNNKIINKNYPNVKNLIEKYNNKESLIFDDIDFDNKENLFTSKCPSLINYLNNNKNIYEDLKKEKNFNCSNDSIPLWLICIRSLSNWRNFTVNLSPIINEELKNKIIEKKSNSINNNIKWLLIINPNNIHFINDNYCEQIYMLFHYILNAELKILSIKNTIFSKIKNIINEIIDSNEFDFNPSSSNNSYENIIKELLNKFLNNFINVSNKFKNLMKESKIILSKKQKKYILDEKEYNNDNTVKFRTIKEIEIDYEKIVKDCYDYNYLIKQNKTKDNLFIQKKDIINSNYYKKDEVIFKGSIFSSFLSYREVEPIKKEEYIEKNRQLEKEKIEIKINHWLEKILDNLNDYENNENKLNIINTLIKNILNINDYNIIGKENYIQLITEGNSLLENILNTNGFLEDIKTIKNMINKIEQLFKKKTKSEPSKKIYKNFFKPLLNKNDNKKKIIKNKYSKNLDNNKEINMEKSNNNEISNMKDQKVEEKCINEDDKIKMREILEKEIKKEEQEKEIKKEKKEIKKEEQEKEIKKIQIT